MTKEWFEMSRAAKKKALHDCWKLMEVRSNEQILILKKGLKHHEAKDLRHDFFYTLIRDFWADVEYAFALSKTVKWQEKVVYPARGALEKLAKLNHVRSINDTEAQLQVVRIECLTVISGLYGLACEEDSKELIEIATEEYNRLSQAGDPEIGADFHKFKSMGFDTFVSMLGNLNFEKSPKFQYFFLSNHIHGNFYQKILLVDDQGVLIRALYLSLLCGGQVLQLTDSLYDSDAEKAKTKVLLDKIDQLFFNKQGDE